MATDTTLQQGPIAKPRGNLETHGMTPLWERMRLITREANSNLNLNIQNLGKDATVGRRHLGLYKDLVLIVEKVREFWVGVPLYLYLYCLVFGSVLHTWNNL